MKNMIRCLALLVAVGLLAGSAYADQSYRITLPTVSKIGDTEFKPGDYKLVVDGTKVLFTEVNTGKTTELEAKIEDAAAKHDGTAILSTRVDGDNKITEIRIGGSKTRIAFN